MWGGLLQDTVSPLGDMVHLYRQLFVSSVCWIFLMFAYCSYKTQWIILLSSTEHRVALLTYLLATLICILSYYTQSFSRFPFLTLLAVFSCSYTHFMLIRDTVEKED
jgi:hypothetical protein